MSPLRSKYQIICLIIFLIPMVLFAQDKKVRKGVKNTEISAETRIHSAQYADGLREFYSKNYTVSEETFRSIINQDSKNDAAYFMLSRIKEEQKDYTGAISYILQAIELNDQNIWYQVALANLYDQIGDYKNSEKVWKKVCNSVTNNEYYLYSLSNALLKNEKYEEVIKTFDKMEEIIGFNDDLTETKKNIWLYLNKVDKAVAEYQKLIQVYPYEVKYYVIIGQIYMVNGLKNNAIEYYKKGESIDSTNLQLMMAFIDYYAELNDNNNRNHYLNKLFAIPDQSEVTLPIFIKEVQKIQKSKQKDQIENGIRYGESFVKANPNIGEGYGNLAQLYAFADNEEKSFENASIAIEKNDLSYEPWHIYLTVLKDRANYSQIISKANDIETLFSTNSYLLSLLGYSYYKMNQQDNAIRILKMSLENSFDNSFSSETCIFLGNIYEDLNKKEEALKYYKLAQKYGNNTPELKFKIGKLQ